MTEVVSLDLPLATNSAAIFSKLAEFSAKLASAIARQETNGAVEWIRTTDLLITNQLLYQLSYNSPNLTIGKEKTADRCDKR